MPAPCSLPDARPADKGPLVRWDTCLAAFSGGGLEGTRHLQLAGRGRTSPGRALPAAGAQCGGYSGFLPHGRPETNPAGIGRAPGTRDWQSPMSARTARAACAQPLRAAPARGSGGPRVGAL